MPFNNRISRSEADALIPEEASGEIIKSVSELNPIMQLARRLPNMSRAQRRMPVMSALATAYFVDGDAGLKQTTEVNWANKYIDAEEIAAIVPIPEAVLEDTAFDCSCALTNGYGCAIMSMATVTARMMTSF
ncbi:MAG: hypothetical protein B6D39_00155 [Anaerolineae bacterium UTCFX2]|nr:MAG: hypothetical protein B6D39_00155 [Anaerolineae bacterium UTCFX2]